MRRVTTLTVVQVEWNQPLYCKKHALLIAALLLLRFHLLLEQLMAQHYYFWEELNTDIPGKSNAEFDASDSGLVA